ncbi:tubulin domain-domain-containing protein [Protomyces lactucae-debilis]|uniref:Tubulin domain-domain-containing protein n=1 Tax=Protomyces lactucae-debilis TaxID=2754530 RepID=A0A1Y2FKL1_PROLT|nr:tubulin domain-containing protein [Protomyces lactucae-debilis]ORY84498.1 tubulin domain-domain-containing protein [Protomyces lactucae-debilis]
MHEILTIQCGERANYLGTHFWNFQEPYFQESDSVLDHDVLYQHGISPTSLEIYLPRVLIYDCARNMGSLRKINQLYDTQVDTESGTEVVQPESFRVHPFQASLDETPDSSQLSDNSVRYWSDYNMQFYRPTSYLPIDTTAVERPLLTYEQGRAAFKERNGQANVMDEDFRAFAEQCDLMQGFNLISSTCDGWSGFTAELLLEMEDEFPKLSKFFVDAGRPTSMQHHFNRADALLVCHDIVDLIVPISTKTSWTGSALPGLWLDTITLPMRTKESPLRLSDLSSFLSPHNKIYHAQAGEQRLNAVHGSVQNKFEVVRGDEVSLTSKVLEGSLVTTFTHPQQQPMPAAFPEGVKETSSSLLHIPRGTRAWLRDLGRHIHQKQGRSGYTERKDVVAALKELEASYEEEFEQISDMSSDDDGF